MSKEKKVPPLRRAQNRIMAVFWGQFRLASEAPRPGRGKLTGFFFWLAGWMDGLAGWVTAWIYIYLYAKDF